MINLVYRKCPKCGVVHPGRESQDEMADYCHQCRLNEAMKEWYNKLSKEKEGRK